MFTANKTYVVLDRGLLNLYDSQEFEFDVGQPSNEMRGSQNHVHRDPEEDGERALESA